MSFPSGLLAHIGAQVSAFQQVMPRHQRCIAEMAWQCVGGRWHNTWEGFTPFTKQQHRDLWGSDATMRRVCSHVYFSVLAGDHDAGRANGFKPRPALMRALETCLVDGAADNFIDPDGRMVRSLRPAIRSRSASGNNTKWDVLPMNAVRINVPEVQLFCQSASDSRLRLGGLKLLKAARTPVCPGRVPVQYEEKSTGRLFAVQGGIQTMPRALRQAALVGFYDYDFSNCHYAILDQLARGWGLRCGAISEYLQNKQAVRRDLANALGVGLGSVKRCLIAIIYGARRAKREGCAIRDELGSEDTAAAFLDHPFVVRLFEDVGHVRRAVLARHHRAHGRIVNRMGLTCDLGAPPAEVLAHVAQGIEAAALREVVRMYEKHMVLLMHDGWVSDIELDVAAIRGRIRDRLGFDLELEAAAIQSPPRMQIDPDCPAEKRLENQSLTQAMAENRANSSPRLPGFPAPGLCLSAAPSWAALPGVHGIPRRRARPV